MLGNRKSQDDESKNQSTTEEIVTRFVVPTGEPDSELDTEEEPLNNPMLFPNGSSIATHFVVQTEEPDLELDTEEEPLDNPMQPILEIVRSNGLALGDIDLIYRSIPQVYMAALDDNPEALKFVPEHVCTKKLCLDLAQKKMWSLQFVPAKFRTPEFYLEALSHLQNPRALLHIPDDIRTDDFYLAAVKINGMALKYVPKHKLTRKICLAAVEENSEAKSFVPAGRYALGFNQVVHSSTVTPPIPEGQKLIFAPMTSADRQEITILNDIYDDAGMVMLEKKSNYNGIYTQGMSSCETLAIVEKNSKGDFTHLSMIHVAGGLSLERLDRVMKVLEQQRSRLTDGTYRECIFSCGTHYNTVSDFKQSINSRVLTEHSTQYAGIDDYLAKKWQHLAFHGESKFTLNKGTACVTFDGYAGPFDCFANMNNFVMPAPNLIDEKRKLKEITGSIKDQKINHMIQAIDASNCDENIKAKLYFHTRELIFKTYFNPEAKSSVGRQVIEDSFEDYKDQIGKLPFSLNCKESIFTTARCFLGMELVTFQRQYGEEEKSSLSTTASLTSVLGQDMLTPSSTVELTTQDQAVVSKVVPQMPTIVTTTHESGNNLIPRSPTSM